MVIRNTYVVAHRFLFIFHYCETVEFILVFSPKHMQFHHRDLQLFKYCETGE
jgi:hypothetical protein